ncbi:MAG: DUF1573 domain-containing protein [Prevotellaceae bacterium]|jgi:hypothetical protein|nr:DUF1573 domain-containing protein [Prevotellaceae bacterium]
MKKIVLLTLGLILGATGISAQQVADIKFTETTIDVGTFPENKTVEAVFNFTNTGSAPLVIHQAIASCGCTIPEFSKEPILPGKSGTIKVTYDGTGKLPGKFQKSVTLRTNAKTELMRLYIKGDMEVKKSE